MNESTYGQFLPFLLKALGGASGGIGTGILGGIQIIGGLSGLSKLKREARPQYEISPELQQAYGLAEERSQMGYTPTQKSYFEQQMARSQQADYLNAIRMGGGTLSGAIAGALGGQRLSALNRFAMEDAAQQARNIAQFYGLAGQMQSQRNLRSEQDIAYRMAKERGLGGALQKGTENFFSTINLATSGLFNKETDTSQGLGSTTSKSNKTYEYPSWAIKQGTTSPKMPSGWFSPMASGFNPNVSAPSLGGGFGFKNPFSNIKPK